MNYVTGEIINENFPAKPVMQRAVQYVPISYYRAELLPDWYRNKLNDFTFVFWALHALLTWFLFGRHFYL